MNRLLRKYSKLLLAVFGTGLMVVFLMPQIPDLVSRFGAGTTLVASMGRDGTTITARDWDEVRNELQFLDRMQGVPGGLPPLPLVGRIDTPEQYYLLVHEAKAAGMIGGMSASGLDSESVLLLSRQTGFPPALIRQALVNRSGIARYLTHVVNAGRHSDRRLKGAGRRLFDAADTQVVSVKADQPSSGAQPDEQAIQQQYDTYRDVEPGEGEHGFGYRLPNRLRLEWLTIPGDAIDESILQSDAMNDRELMKYWRRNEATHPGFEDSNEIPESVRNGLLADLRDDYTDNLSRSITDRLRLPRRGFEETGGYLVLPDDWASRQVSFDQIREMLRDEYQLEIEPVFTSGDDLITLPDIRDLEGIGQARSDKFSRFPILLQQMVTDTKELGGSGLYPVQQGVAGPIMTDTQKNMYVFRVTEADGARPPATLDEVREGVVSDLQRLAHYEELLAQVDDMEQLSETEGLETLATQWEVDPPTGKVFQKYLPGTVEFYLSQGMQPQPAAANVPGLLLQDPDVVEAILASTSAIDHETSVEDLDESDRILVLPSEQNLAVVAVRLVNRRPLDRDSYLKLTTQNVIPMLVMTEELGGDLTRLQDSFTVEALRDRHGFVFAGNEGENANATADLADATN